MKRITLSAAALIAMLSASSNLVAQSTESTQQISATSQQKDKKMSLSLQDAINYALEHNRELKNASLEVQKAEMQRWQTIAQMLLQVDATFSYIDLFGFEVDYSQMMGGSSAASAAAAGAGSTSMAKKMHNYGQLGVSASAGVSAQGIIGAQLKRMAKEIQETSVLKSQQETKYNVEATYAQILAFEETVRLLETSVGNLEKMKSMTENAVKAGVAEQNDANQISIQVASIKNTLNSTKRTIEALYNSLILSIGADSDAEITLTQSFSDLVNEGTILDLTNSTLDLNQNLDYQMLTKQTEITNKQKKMAVAAFLPSVGVAYTYTARTYFGGEEDFNSNPPHVLTANISVPVFSSGKRTCAVKEAKIAQMEQANTVENTEIGLKIQEKQLKYNLTSAYENYNVQKENIKVMESVFNSYGEKFKYGRASSMDVTNSSISLTSAQSDYIQSMLQMVNANIELKKLLNK